MGFAKINERTVEKKSTHVCIHTERARETWMSCVKLHSRNNTTDKYIVRCVCVWMWVASTRAKVLNKWARIYEFGYKFWQSSWIMVYSPCIKIITPSKYKMWKWFKNLKSIERKCKMWLLIRAPHNFECWLNIEANMMNCRCRFE